MTLRLMLVYLLSLGPTAAHRGGISLDTFDFYTPALQALRQEYRKATAEAAKTRNDALREMVQNQLKAAEEMLAEKKKTGNITGMAVARNLLTIFEECDQSLQKTGDFTLNDRVRRELTETLEACRQRKKDIDVLYRASVEPLEQDFYARFVEVAKTQGAAHLPDSHLRELFRHFLATEDRVATRSEQTPATAKPTPFSPGTEELTPPPVPEILGTSGPAERWISLGYWYAEISNVEVLRIPVLQADKTVRDTVVSDATGASITARYHPLAVLTQASPERKFQLKSRPRHLGADLIEWPGPGNDWHLVVRLRPWGTLPSRHGLEIQVDGEAPVQPLGISPVPSTNTPARSLGSPPAPNTTPPPPTMLTIRLATDPAGAGVYLNGGPVLVTGMPVVTPCVIEVPPGTHSLVLRRTGYLAAHWDALTVSTNRVIEHRLTKEPPPRESILKVFDGEGWHDSRVSVTKGDRLVLSVSGTWSCVPSGEQVGPLGYPQDSERLVYYGGPKALARLYNGANLGALLARIGERGAIRVMGNEERFVAEMDGTLRFGINESNRGGGLADNKGALTIRIQNFGSGVERLVDSGLDVTAAEASFSGQPTGVKDSGASTGIVSAAQAAVPNTVTLRLVSEPPGAAVYVDGQPVEMAGVPARTPCAIETTRGRHTITLKLFRYADGTYPDFLIESDLTLEHRFLRDTAGTDTTLTVFAREGWRQSYVTVNRGDRLAIFVMGSWTCLPREENVGPEGYPPDRAHAEYYVGPSALWRVYPRANIGALLMRIGANGFIRALGRSQRLVAETSGALWFGINEADRGNALSDNRGALTIHLQNLGPEDATRSR